MATRDDDRGTMPTRTIHGAYREALQARRNYQTAAGGPFEANAHEQLHDAVAAYYEVLRPLVSASNSTEHLWTDEKLWPTQPVYVEVGLCLACGANEAVDQLDDVGVELGEPCPNCENAVVEKAQIPETDDDGQVIYDHVEGLQAVDGAWSQTDEHSVEYSDALGTHTETRVETQLLDPAHLQAIARALDEALERLALHADVDDEAPTTELDNEDLEKFQEQLAKIRDEWDGEEGLDESEVTDT